MTGFTFCVAVLAVLGALTTTPGRALAIYCASLVLYPQALTLQIGTVDFSVSRICILAVLANAVFFSKRWRFFEWSWVDVFVLAAWALGFVALLQTFPAVAVERHAGAFFDTILPYIAARLIVTSQEELLTLVKSLAVIAVPIAILAVGQMLTGTNPIGFLSDYYNLGMAGHRVEHHEVRLGLYRAAVTFTHAISLGLFFALVGTLTLMLWEYRVWSRPLVAGFTAIAAIGLFTSLSSGPMIAVAGACFVFLVYFDARLVMALAALAFASVASIAAYSGEPYADVLTDFALNPETAQFRLDLYREALNGGMSGHWWTGYGYVGQGPGTDSTNFHWRKDDIVSIYLLLLVRTGLLGLLPFVVANVLYYVRLVQALLLARTREASWMAWCVLAGMAGWNLGMLTVAPLTAILQLLFVFIAISTNMPTIVTARAPRGG